MLLGILNLKKGCRNNKKTLDKYNLVVYNAFIKIEYNLIGKNRNNNFMEAKV